MIQDFLDLGYDSAELHWFMSFMELSEIDIIDPTIDILFYKIKAVSKKKRKSIAENLINKKLKDKIQEAIDKGRLGMTITYNF